MNSMSKMESLEDFLYYLFAILLLVSFITVIWIFFNKLQIRALYRNNLPNHKDLLNCSSSPISNPTISSTELKPDLPNARQTVKQTSQNQIRERRLPPQILPYDNKPIISNKNDIIKKCKQMHQQRDQKQASTVSFTQSSISQITTHSESDLSRKIKNQASQNEQKLKASEAEEKRKREEERNAKKAAIDKQAKEDAEKAKASATTQPILGGVGFSSEKSNNSLSSLSTFSFHLPNT